MSIDEVKSLFIIARIPILNHWELLNGYWGKNEVRGPWWLVKTPRGLIRIGWRKRVIEIDWSDTDIQKTVTEDDVTKSDKMVHAWTIVKALEYLNFLWNHEV